MTDTRKEILALVRQFHDEAHGTKPTFAAGDRVNYAGRVFDGKELENLVDSALDFWLTAGRYAEEFESRLAEFLEINYCFLTNSGSSANLLAFMTLTSPKLKDRRIQKGDEVVTVAAGFPTTVAPIIQYGAVPVFVDVEIPSYNIDVAQLEHALSKKSKAVFLAHTLGNPFDLSRVKEFCDEHRLWLIEDNCDSLGSKYLIDSKWQYTGTIGDIGTSSFYPPHHITMGEGGAVYTDNPELERIIDSFRNWGRDCRCKSGQDNLCGKRFSQQFGSLPLGYDHKYVFSHLGYNLKATEMQAAIGCAQLDKLSDFIAARKKNWSQLYDAMRAVQSCFILPEPQKSSDPSWFGFMLTLRGNVLFSRNDIVTFLESRNVQTRVLFAGNLVRHPCFDTLTEGRDYRVVGSLAKTDRVMMDSFWLGVYPELSEAVLDYVTALLTEYATSSGQQIR